MTTTAKVFYEQSLSMQRQQIALLQKLVVASGGTVDTSGTDEPTTAAAPEPAKLPAENKSAVTAATPQPGNGQEPVNLAAQGSTGAPPTPDLPAPEGVPSMPAPSGDALTMAAQGEATGPAMTPEEAMLEEIRRAGLNPTYAETVNRYIQHNNGIPGMAFEQLKPEQVPVYFETLNKFLESQSLQPLVIS